MAAAIRLSQQHSCSFDHLVGLCEQGRRRFSRWNRMRSPPRLCRIAAYRFSVGPSAVRQPIAGVRCTRATLIYLKAVRLDWSRPARDFIDDKLGEVIWRSALALDPCDPELMQAAFNRWSIKCLARCIVELLDDL